MNDPSLNAFIISYLIDLEAVEAAPLIERAYASDDVDITVVGDWEDAQVDLGLLTARKTQRPRLFPDLLDLPRLDARDPEPARQTGSADKAPSKARNKRKQAKESRKKNRKRKKQ